PFVGRPGHRDGLPAQLPGVWAVEAHQRHVAGPVERDRPRARRRDAAPRERAGQPLAALAAVAALQPEVRQRRAQPQLAVGAVAAGARRRRGGVAGRRRARGGRGRGAARAAPGGGARGPGGEGGGGGGGGGGAPAARPQPLLGVLPERLEQAVALLRAVALG